MKITFGFVPTYATWNHGIALLSAVAKEEGAETALVLLKGEVKDVVARVAEEGPTVVMVSSVTVHDTLATLPYAKALREAGHTVLLGGVFARHAKPPCGDIFDRVCTGEAESAMRRFVRTKKLDEFEYPGDARMLNALPLPDYFLFAAHPLEDRGIGFLRNKSLLPYHSARGCPHQCSFCLAPHQPGKVRVRTKVDEDLSVLWDGKPYDMLVILDELMPYWSDGWLDSWNDRRVPFCGYIRADIPERTLQKLIDRGLSGAIFGVESGSEAYRNSVLRKGLLDSDIWRTVYLLNDAKVPWVSYFMTDTPEQTVEEAMATDWMLHQMVDRGGMAVLWGYEPLTVAGGGV